VPFDEGLTDAEILQAERKYDLHFPHDLREFLQTVLPIHNSTLPLQTALAGWARGKLGIRYALRHFTGLYAAVAHSPVMRLRVLPLAFGVIAVLTLQALAGTAEQSQQSGRIRSSHSNPRTGWTFRMLSGSP
jgi:hypothetical protein